MVTRWPPTRRTGTPRGRSAAAPSGVSKRGSRTTTDSSAVVEQGQHRVDVAEVEVPLADAGLAEAVAQGAVRDDGLAGARVDEHGLERGVLLVGVLGEVGGGEELAGGVRAARWPSRRASSRRTRWGRSV